MLDNLTEVAARAGLPTSAIETVVSPDDQIASLAFDMSLSDFMLSGLGAEEFMLTKFYRTSQEAREHPEYFDIDLYRDLMQMFIFLQIETAAADTSLDEKAEPGVRATYDLMQKQLVLDRNVLTGRSDSDSEKTAMRSCAADADDEIADSATRRQALFSTSLLGSTSRDSTDTTKSLEYYLVMSLIQEAHLDVLLAASRRVMLCGLRQQLSSKVEALHKKIPLDQYLRGKLQQARLANANDDNLPGDQEIKAFAIFLEGTPGLGLTEMIALSRKGGRIALSRADDEAGAVSVDAKAFYKLLNWVVQTQLTEQERTDLLDKNFIPTVKSGARDDLRELRRALRKEANTRFEKFAEQKQDERSRADLIGNLSYFPAALYQQLVTQTTKAVCDTLPSWTTEDPDAKDVSSAMKWVKLARRKVLDGRVTFAEIMKAIIFGSKDTGNKKRGKALHMAGLEWARFSAVKQLAMINASHGLQRALVNLSDALGDGELQGARLSDNLAAVYLALTVLYTSDCIHTHDALLTHMRRTGLGSGFVSKQGQALAQQLDFWPLYRIWCVMAANNISMMQGDKAGVSVLPAFHTNYSDHLINLVERALFTHRDNPFENSSEYQKAKYEPLHDRLQPFLRHIRGEHNENPATLAASYIARASALGMHENDLLDLDTVTEAIRLVRSDTISEVEKPSQRELMYFLYKLKTLEEVAQSCDPLTAVFNRLYQCPSVLLRWLEPQAVLSQTQRDYLEDNFLLQFNLVNTSNHSRALTKSQLTTARVLAPTMDILRAKGSLNANSAREQLAKDYWEMAQGLLPEADMISLDEISRVAETFAAAAHDSEQQGNKRKLSDEQRRVLAFFFKVNMLKQAQMLNPNCEAHSQVTTQLLEQLRRKPEAIQPARVKKLLVYAPAGIWSPGGVDVDPTSEKGVIDARIQRDGTTVSLTECLNPRNTTKEGTWLLDWQLMSVVIDVLRDGQLPQTHATALVTAMLEHFKNYAQKQQQKQETGRLLYAGDSIKRQRFLVMLAMVMQCHKIMSGPVTDSKMGRLASMMNGFYHKADGGPLTHAFPKTSSFYRLLSGMFMLPSSALRRELNLSTEMMEGTPLLKVDFGELFGLEERQGQLLFLTDGSTRQQRLIEAARPTEMSDMTGKTDEESQGADNLEAGGAGASYNIGRHA